MFRFVCNFEDFDLGRGDGCRLEAMFSSTKEASRWRQWGQLVIWSLHSSRRDHLLCSTLSWITRSHRLTVTSVEESISWYTQMIHSICRTSAQRNTGHTMRGKWELLYSLSCLGYIWEKDLLVIDDEGWLSTNYSVWLLDFISSPHLIGHHQSPTTKVRVHIPFFTLVLQQHRPKLTN